MNKSLHPVLIKINASRSDMLSLLLKHTTHCFTVLTSTVWPTSVFSKQRWMSVNAIISSRSNAVSRLGFICTSMPDTILSECPSAAICHTAMEWDMGGKVQPLLLYHQHPPLTSRVPMPWNRRHYFRSSKAQCVTVWFLSALFLSMESTALTKGEASDWCWWQKGKYWM